MAINLVAHSFGQYQLAEDEEILITEMEHCKYCPWQQIVSSDRLKV